MGSRRCYYEKGRGKGEGERKGEGVRERNKEGDGAGKKRRGSYIPLGYKGLRSVKQQEVVNLQPPTFTPLITLPLPPILPTSPSPFHHPYPLPQPPFAVKVIGRESGAADHPPKGGAREQSLGMDSEDKTLFND